MFLLLEGTWNPEDIDWDTEIALSDDLKIRLAIPYMDVPASRSIVLLTGATGSSGRTILVSLQLDEAISEECYISICDLEKHTQLAAHGKISLYPGDMTLPSLGPADSSAEGFAQATCIIYAAADVSHRRAYHSLRASMTYIAITEQ